MNEKFKFTLKFGDKKVLLHFDFLQKIIRGFRVIINSVFKKGKSGGEDIKNVVIHFAFVQKMIQYLKPIFTKKNILAVFVAVMSVFGMHFWIGWSYEGSIFIAFAAYRAQ